MFDMSKRQRRQKIAYRGELWPRFCLEQLVHVFARVALVLSDKDLPTSHGRGCPGLGGKYSRLVRPASAQLLARRASYQGFAELAGRGRRNPSPDAASRCELIATRSLREPRL